jgi:hypothetical protein
MRSNVSKLVGLTLASVVRNTCEEGGDQIEFTTVEGRIFRMNHQQDCCEHVEIESIVGDLADLVGSPVVMAEESISQGSDEDEWGTQTWTFYKFATRKGFVDIRWFGSSNGYYSESVDFEEVEQ